MSYVCSTLLQLFQISSKKLCTHMKLVIMFIENKQSQHFSSHTHEWLFLFPELCIIPKYFRTSWVNTLGYYLLIVPALILYHQRRNYLKILNESIHLDALSSSYCNIQFSWLTIQTALDKSNPLAQNHSHFSNQNVNAKIHYLKMPDNVVFGIFFFLKEQRKKEAH